MSKPVLIRYAVLLIGIALVCLVAVSKLPNKPASECESFGITQDGIERTVYARSASEARELHLCAGTLRSAPYKPA